MGPQKKLGVYIGYECPSILKYLEPITWDQFIARYTDCIFNEDHFLALGGDKNQKLKECQEILWNVKDLQYLDLGTSQTELEVLKIINLQYLASNLLDAFTDHKGVTKSNKNTCYKHTTKCGRLIYAKDKNPRKTKSNKKKPSHF